MTLNYRDSKYLLSNFPSIKLSYEKKIHKKVFPLDIIITIPKGKKYFAWFCKFKNKPVCVFLELDNYRKGIKNINIFNCCFDSKLAIKKGTIFYGTMFYYKKMRCFNIENIYYFMNKNISNETQHKKFEYIGKIFDSYIKQVSYHLDDVVFGIPIVETKRNIMLDKLETVPYEIYCIQHRSLYHDKQFLNEIVDIKKQTTNQIFLIKAEVADDIYNLYYKNTDNELELYESAFIPDFNTSRYMNSLFRNIKENENLDALEESDDDDDFENISDDKNVNLKREIKMECVYREKFKSWIPLKIIDKGSVCTKMDLNF